MIVTRAVGNAADAGLQARETAEGDGKAPGEPGGGRETAFENENTKSEIGSGTHGGRPQGEEGR